NLNHVLLEVDATEDKEIAALKLIDAERKAFDDLYRIKSNFALSKPRGVSMGKKVEQDYVFL
ncbi:MAG TPA: hypothetical protein PLC57_07515, partial [Sulfurovum sp.]|nr:hypothetical protein [Sulfurovum sp.]